MTFLDINHQPIGLWSSIYKFGGIGLFGVAMFGLGASAGTAVFKVPALWKTEAVLHHEETVVIPAIKGKEHHALTQAPVSADCPPAHPSPAASE